MEKIKIDVKADIRGEIIDIFAEDKKIRLIHTLPGCHRGGYVFHQTEKRAILIDGDNTFYFTDPKNPKKEEIHKVSAGDEIIIPKGTAYREFTENGTYFVGFMKGDNKWVYYEPYRKIVEDSLTH